MLCMCRLSFAQEEKNELGLLLGVEFIPRAAATSNQELVSVEASRILLIMRAVYPAETPPCSWSFRSLQAES